jgi:hypothetical protein
MNTTIEIPERMKKLAVYKGFPITATTLMEGDIPNFKVVNTSAVWEFKRDRKCAMCGEPLDYWIGFVVSEKEAETRFIYESPAHVECLEYAFKICPWLAYTNAHYSIPENIKFRTEGLVAAGSHPEREVRSQRPDKLGIYICRSYENVMHNGMRVCKAAYAKTIIWIEGR